jgi:tetratricopeptide (TPR) repeat protein
VIVRRAPSSFRKWDVAEAAKEYRKAIELDPTLGPAYTNLGGLAFRQGSFDAAVEYADKSIAVDPDELMAYHLRGLARLQLDLYLQAIEDSNIALKDRDLLKHCSVEEQPSAGLSITGSRPASA